MILVAGIDFHDTIVLCEENKVIPKLGGVWNLADFFGSKFEYKMCIKNTAYAVILISNNDKKVFVDWRDSKNFEFNYSIPKFISLIHFVYLDVLDKINQDFLCELKEKGIKLSCDFCLKDGWKNKEELISFFDYLFISDSEIELKDINYLRHYLMSKNSYLFYHNPKGSEVFWDDKFEKFNAEHVDVKNIVGAGDYFAASILKDLYEYNFKYKPEMVSNAHKNVKKMLMGK